MADKVITDALWRDGYHAAAKLIEQLENSLQQPVELDWMKQFAKESRFDEELARDQLRSLWTAYCLHYGYDVDTADYDRWLGELWAVVSEDEPGTADWSDFESFDLFMGRYLC